ncbi:MAG: hypothetical protein ACOH2F_12620 [Cellulomonas sp.]
MRKYSKRTTVIAVTTAILLGTAGGAYAYWTSTGGGSGTATTAGTATTLVVHQSGTGITGLVPGGAPQDLSGTFTNSDKTPNVSIKVKTLNTSVKVDNQDCDDNDFVIAGSVKIIDANNASQSWSGLTIQLVNTAENQDACKGAVATVTYTVVPEA